MVQVARALSEREAGKVIDIFQIVGGGVRQAVRLSDLRRILLG